jgi:hypothetical protein
MSLRIKEKINSGNDTVIQLNTCCQLSQLHSKTHQSVSARLGVTFQTIAIFKNNLISRHKIAPGWARRLVLAINVYEYLHTAESYGVLGGFWGCLSLQTADGRCS